MKYLEGRLWPNGVTCPGCKSKDRITTRKGISSLQLAKEIGVTQKSAWFMLQRLREACSQNSDKLRGIVEIDETFIGGLESNKHEADKLKMGRGSVGKAPVWYDSTVLRVVLTECKNYMVLPKTGRAMSRALLGWRVKP